MHFKFDLLMVNENLPPLLAMVWKRRFRDGDSGNHSLNYSSTFSTFRAGIRGREAGTVPGQRCLFSFSPIPQPQETPVR